MKYRIRIDAYDVRVIPEPENLTTFNGILDSRRFNHKDEAKMHAYFLGGAIYKSKKDRKKAAKIMKKHPEFLL